jgi:hypothetical protein
LAAETLVEVGDRKPDSAPERTRERRLAGPSASEDHDPLHGGHSPTGTNVQ